MKRTGPRKGLLPRNTRKARLCGAERLGDLKWRAMMHTKIKAFLEKKIELVQFARKPMTNIFLNGLGLMLMGIGSFMMMKNSGWIDPTRSPDIIIAMAGGFIGGGWYAVKAFWLIR